jgi:hypothetical protein
MDKSRFISLPLAGEKRTTQTFRSQAWIRQQLQKQRTTEVDQVLPHWNRASQTCVVNGAIP